GLLRNLLVRKGINTGEILVDIVTTSETLLDEEEFARGILSMPLHGKLTGVLHTLNDGVADAVKNDSTSVIYGRDYIYDEVLGLRFKISIFSFFQTNTHGAELLYSKVREYVELASGNMSRTDRDETSETGDIGVAKAIGVARGTGVTRGIGVYRGIGVVYDLYSGTGTIAQLMADVASRVYGVEIVPEAVEAAGVNAGLNHIDNVQFICGDVLKVLDDLAEKPDLIILDPPRDGVNPKALKKILEYGVQNIVYISCKITSLARDLHPILDAGYRPVRISVTDMFPKTANVEVVSLLDLI
ncbi:MAG: methyltransferase domain-containing protein, partial [Lachnospiraceae bacterium]|nr:methyltransferase domain-containing protein [Lachnospiraceae bacterium]